ncbi:uncharacterized protein BJ171DRAFT_454315 [Polychytrium aggregatum]|uniref:uncharacterized protein n=1 Tax=Polychytrium aggregatum TaxID=110093 RepID=UPI0022FEF48C|nr:uncharacterized protein BJ171DRAFT_454315 [Polychytrium aggregatum]KAI9209337.1 hypothetical protein BJ171DRAFT_454315 [Polychytrium aggregatum]
MLIDEDSTRANEGASKPLRILMATEYLPPHISGIANRCKNLIKGYRDNGHHVTVVSVAGTDCDIVAPSVPNPFYTAQRMFIAVPLLLLWQLLDFTTPVPYDIIHAVGPLCFPFIFAMPLFKLRGVKVYISYHVYLQYYKRHYFGDNLILGMIVEGLYLLFYFMPLVCFADVVGIPSRTADWCVFAYSKRIHVMKSGLDTTLFAPREDEAVSVAETLATPTSQLTQRVVPDQSSRAGPILVYVGRLAAEKNVDFLIASMKHPKLAKTTLVIVGDGPERQRLEGLAEEIVGADRVYSYSGSQPGDIGLLKQSSSKRVIFAGMITDERETARFYAHADLFVSASASETFGFTVAESLSCATPAVVVRSGAFATIYRMIDEWMFEEGNVEDYADKITRTFKDRVVARKVSRRIAVNQFSVEAAIRNLLKTYECIVDEREHELESLDAVKEK